METFFNKYDLAYGEVKEQKERAREVNEYTLCKAVSCFKMETIHFLFYTRISGQ